MLNLTPLTKTVYDVMLSIFKDYMIVGGMPAIVNTFIKNNNFSGILKMQKQILLDYEEDITKYAGGLDKTKILNAYRKIPVFLGNENKKFQISKITDGARNREYVGVIDWLSNAGIVNVCYCMEKPMLPLKANYNPDNYRLYFADTGLLIGSLEEEVQEDLRNNENLNTYKGALYENIVADAWRKRNAAVTNTTVATNNSENTNQNDLDIPTFLRRKNNQITNGRWHYKYRRLCVCAMH